MPLTAERKKQLRTLGHNLNPVVTVAGKGLSDTVMNEINRALDDHELIKVKFAVGDREIKNQLIDQMIDATGAEIAQKIGNIALIVREAKKPNAKLSNLLR